MLLSKLPDEMLDYYLDLMGRLSGVLGDRVDLVILNTAPPLLKHQVIKYGKVLYSRDEVARVKFESRVEKEYMDLAPLYDRYDEALIEDILKRKD